MGQTTIKAAGDYLLSVLRQEPSVPYSRFYNHARDANEQLAGCIMRFLPGGAETAGYDRNDFLDHGHLYLEWAAWQLSDLRLVEISELSGQWLADGEPDFLIALTGKGGEFLAQGRTFAYRHLNSRFNAEQASRWLIDFAHANTDAADEFTLSGMAAVGDPSGGVTVEDDCPLAESIGRALRGGLDRGDDTERIAARVTPADDAIRRGAPEGKWEGGP